MMKSLIKAQDLRKGNFHQSDDFSIPRLGLASVKVDGKSYSAISTWGIHLVDQEEMEFIPLRLTEEWMFAFGFERANTVEIIYTKIGFSNILCVGAKYYIRGVLEPIEYVHDFQNVYYFLQRQELIIK